MDGHLRCLDCGAGYYSVVARERWAEGERCERCGGRLVIDPHTQQETRETGRDPDEPT